MNVQFRTTPWRAELRLGRHHTLAMTRNLLFKKQTTTSTKPIRHLLTTTSTPTYSKLFNSMDMSCNTHQLRSPLKTTNFRQTSTDLYQNSRAKNPPINRPPLA